MRNFLAYVDGTDHLPTIITTSSVHKARKTLRELGYRNWNTAPIEVR